MRSSRVFAATAVRLDRELDRSVKHGYDPAPIPAPRRRWLCRCRRKAGARDGDQKQRRDGNSSRHIRASLGLAHLPTLFDLLLGLVLALHLLKLLTLIFDFLLLRVNLGLGLSICVFVVLHLVTHYVSANASDTRADSRARKRSTYCRTDDRASCSTETCADESTLLSRREWLS